MKGLNLSHEQVLSLCTIILSCASFCWRNRALNDPFLMKSGCNEALIQKGLHKLLKGQYGLLRQFIVSIASLVYPSSPSCNAVCF